MTDNQLLERITIDPKAKSGILGSVAAKRRYKRPDAARPRKIEMNRHLYQQYLQEFIDQSARDSDGSVRGIYEQLSEMQVKGLVVRHREEKRRALADAQQAFAEHSHWPLEIILSHLGVEAPPG